MFAPWWGVALALSVMFFVWPLTFSVAFQLHSHVASLDLSMSGLLWRLRLRALPEGVSEDEVFAELRVLHFIGWRKTFPAMGERWRRFKQVWRLVQRWEGSVGPADDKTAASERVTWAEVKQWNEGRKGWRPALRAVRRGARFARRRLRIKSLRLHLLLGTSDAAVTARLCGLAWAIGGGIFGLAHRKLHFDQKPDVHIRPVYNRYELGAHGHGEATLMQGHALLAFGVALAAFLRYRRSEAKKGERAPVAGPVESAG